MKAIRVHQFGSPEVLRLEEVPDPRPARGQLVVRVHAAGVNPVEAYVRSGIYASLPDLPYTPGTDAGGVVEAVGEGASTFAVGDRVFATHSLTGTYAEKTVCEVAHVFPLPPSVSFAQGAAIGVPYGTAWRALFQKARAGGAAKAGLDHSSLLAATGLHFAFEHFVYLPLKANSHPFPELRCEHHGIPPGDENPWRAILAQLGEVWRGCTRAAFSVPCNLPSGVRTQACTSLKQAEDGTMLWLIFLILLIAWILGLVGTYQIGALVWLLLVAALIVLVIQLVTGRRPVA
jgi:hypothetical protein